MTHSSGECHGDFFALSTRVAFKILALVVSDSLKALIKTAYYIDKSGLVENRPLVTVHTKLHPGLEWRIFQSSLVRISMTSFPALTLLFVQKYSCLYNKKNITRWLEDMNFIFSR